MDLKARFSLTLSAVILLVVAGFAFTVYEQVKVRQLVSAEAALQLHMEHEWRHLELGQDHGHDHPDGTLQTKHVYLKLWKNGELESDSFPHGVEEPPRGTHQQRGSMLIRDDVRTIGEIKFELLGVYDLSTTLGYLRGLRNVLSLGCLLTLLVILPLSWFLTRSLLRPFRALSHTTRELDEMNLSFRFPEPKVRDEYGTLVHNFNSLLTRLETSFRQIRRFASNVSHELRTPLTVIRGEAEVALRRSRDTEEYRDALRQVVGHAEKLQGIVHRLLFLANLERMELENELAPIDVGKAVSETLRTLHRIYDPNLKQVEVAGDATVFVGQPGLFSSIVCNLMENALKYSRSQVQVRYEKESRGVRLRFEDDGDGIPTERREGVFEPFGRARWGNHTQGHGLGLSIVKACVDALHGEIGLGDSRLGGLSVEVLLPDHA